VIECAFRVLPRVEAETVHTIGGSEALLRVAN
jgi:hypothetical protein